MYGTVVLASETWQCTKRKIGLQCPTKWPLTTGFGDVKLLMLHKMRNSVL